MPVCGVGDGTGGAWSRPAGRARGMRGCSRVWSSSRSACAQTRRSDENAAGLPTSARGAPGPRPAWPWPHPREPASQDPSLKRCWSTGSSGTACRRRCLRGGSSRQRSRTGAPSPWRSKWGSARLPGPSWGRARMSPRAVSAGSPASLRRRAATTSAGATTTSCRCCSPPAARRTGRPLRHGTTRAGPRWPSRARAPSRPGSRLC